MAGFPISGLSRISFASFVGSGNPIEAIVSIFEFSVADSEKASLYH